MPRLGWCLGLLLMLSGVARGGELVDGVVATVGTHPVFLSDVEMEIARARMQGGGPAPSRCEVLESVLIHNLFLDQADLDSIPSNATGESPETDRRIAYFIQQAGGEAGLEKAYGRPIQQIRKDLQKMLDEQQRTSQVRQSVVRDVQVTPSEVRAFYAGEPRDSLPMMPVSYIYRQLVLDPTDKSLADYEVRERLLKLRGRIIKGERFSTLAVAYSEDRGSAIKGGEMGYLPKESFVKPFADAAASLREGQVSNIVKTEYGYHIIQMIGRKDKLINVRHILLKPSYTSEMIARTSQRLDSIRGLLSDSLTFAQACERYSQDKDTKMNGGYAVNPMAGGLRFEKEAILPVDFYALQELKEGQVSRPYESRDRLGNAVVKMVQLERIIPAHRVNLELDYDRVQELAKQRKERKVLEEWIGKKVGRTYIHIDPEYKSCRFERSAWTPKFESAF